MRILIIDTSTEKSLVAWGEEGRIVRTHHLASGLQSSRYLFQAIESLELKISTLDAIGVTIGPGLFTGIRVGVSAARGLALGTKLPLLGISSLRGFVSEQEGIFASLIEASQGSAHVLLQERKGEVIHALDTPKLLTQNELREYVKEVPLIGPQFRRTGLVGKESFANPQVLLEALLQEPHTHFQLLY